MSDPTPEDSDLTAAARAALQMRAWITSVLDAVMDDAVSCLLAGDLGLDDRVADRFAEALVERIETGLDPDERVQAIAVLLEPAAQQQADRLREDMAGRLGRIPEVPGVEP